MSSSGGGAPLRVYRTLPARVIGWGLLGAAVVLTVLTVMDIAQGHHQGLIAPVALIVGVGTIGWVLFLRPKAELFADRVELTNIVTDTVVPFTQVTDVTHQWSLELHDTAGVRHSSWAVPVRREMARRKPIDDYAETTRQRGRERMTAQGAADDVLRAIDRWELAGGQKPDSASTDAAVGATGAAVGASGAEPATDAGISRRVSWPVAAVLVLACVLTVVALVS